MKSVTHLVRKNTQLKAAFINNQILGHLQYNPTIVYKYHSKKNDGGFANSNYEGIPMLDLSRDHRYEINFYYLKKISNNDVNNVLQFLKNSDSSVLHLHYATDACIYSDVMKNSGLPSIVSCYGYDISSFPKTLWGLGAKYLQQRLFKYATRILAMSPDMKKDLIQAGCPEEKIKVHYYGVNTNFFSKITREYSRKDKVKLLILASLTPKKGHLFLLKAIKELLKKGIRNFKFNIVGSGSIEKELKAYCSNNNLLDNVAFFPGVGYESEDMVKTLAAADIFIHPSVVAPSGDKEGIPGTIVEAMASGLPVISTYHAGIPYIINHNKTGLLVDEWDVKALAEKITMLIEDGALRKKLGISGQEYAMEHLDFEKKEEELEAIYTTLIN